MRSRIAFIRQAAACSPPKQCVSRGGNEWRRSRPIPRQSRTSTLHWSSGDKAPSWDAPVLSVMIWFIRQDGETDFEGNSWDELLKQWLKLTPSAGRFVDVHGQMAGLDDLNAADYVESDVLDLDHLSTRQRDD